MKIHDAGFDAEPLTEEQQAILAADPAFVAMVHQSMAEAEAGTPMSAEDAMAWLRNNL